MNEPVNKQLDNILNPIFEDMVADKVGLVWEFSCDILNAENEERQYVRELQEKVTQQIKSLITLEVEKALEREVGHWVTESNLDYELFNMRISKRFKQLRKSINNKKENV